MIKRIFLEPARRYKETIYSDIIRFIASHADKHITHRSYSYFNTLPDLGVGVLHTVSIYGKQKILGFSGASFNPVDFSITVVHDDFRGLGIGSALLKEKIALLPQYHTLVAEDNKASIATCLKAGLVKVGESTALRNEGKEEYKVIHFEKIIGKNKCLVPTIEEAETPKDILLGLVDVVIEDTNTKESLDAPGVSASSLSQVVKDSPWYAQMFSFWNKHEQSSQPGLPTEWVP